MTNYISSILYIILFSNVFLVAIIFSRGIKNLVNFLFSLMSLGVVVWSIFIFGFYELPWLKLNWLAGTHSTALFISLIFYCFSLNFPKKIYRNINLYLWPILIFVIAFYFIIFTNYVIGERDGLNYIIGPGYLLYQFIFTVYSLLGFFFLKKQFQATKTTEEKSQVKYIFSGALITVFLATITNLIFPYLGLFNYTWLGPIFTFILITSVFIAITRYHLFNIKIIATESFIFLLNGFLLSRFIISTGLQDIIINGGLLAATTIISYFLILSVKNEVTQREKIQKLAEDLALTNNKLEFANDKLKELNRQKTEFVSIASHQLRSPLTAIKGYSSMLLEGSFGPIEDRAKEAVEVVFQSSLKLINIIEDFLNITRIELGRMKYEISIFDLGKIVETVINDQIPNIKKKGLTSKLEKGESNDTYLISADNGKITQVISNLIDNSIKYTPQGEIKAKIENLLISGKSVIRFSISDTGVGIDQETLPRLFDKFVRADDAGKTNITGTGLGLYVAKQIVESLGGKIWAESEGKGKGSTFIVEFPKAEGEITQTDHKVEFYTKADFNKLKGK